MKIKKNKIFSFQSKLTFAIIFIIISSVSCSNNKEVKSNSREKISINSDWKFYKYDSQDNADSLIYDVRPEINDFNFAQPADSKPTEAAKIQSTKKVLKDWILPTGNYFIKDTTKHYKRPEGNPGSDFEFVQNYFDDSNWEDVDLPHDWAIKGPFYEGENPIVDGGMGRLPSQGVAWYRKKLNFDKNDKDKMIYLDVDGAMSYAMVWFNGNLVGGWPYGYNSWRVDLTPFVNYEGDNQLALRLDNPNYSARWYPGGGIYRNVWLTKVNNIHVAQWGTFVTTPDVSKKEAKIDLEINLKNDDSKVKKVNVTSFVYEIDKNDNLSKIASAKFNDTLTYLAANKISTIKTSTKISNPKLWGPKPQQNPNLYSVITKIKSEDKIIDEYKTVFGIRSLKFDPNSGILVNDERIEIKGVNNHHDLGALGAAFNKRAAERQLEILQEMGCNAIRMAHNPPAPELLELTDKMGMLVMDEVFDVWQRKKTPYDFHLIFDDWHEQDLRSMVRRDRNHPSIIIWSYGNEVGEQYTDEDGAQLGLKLSNIIKEEDPTRPTTSAMNWAKPFMPFPKSMDLISLNYQGQGIRQEPMFKGTDRIRTVPQFPAYHETFPNKVILSSETASAFSSRGIYLFPVSDKISSPTRDGIGGDSNIHQVSSYELYAVDFGSSADKVFKSNEENPFIAGEFVWTGWDYLGEPTPYYSARSSYTGIIDLAGFKKDRFYLYQSHWRPDYPMVHILPHWNWPERIGKVTPVHIFTSGDEVELFLNDKFLGKKKKGEFEYRLRWDDIIYEPGVLKAVAYKNGKVWAEEIIKTTKLPEKLDLSVDRSEIYLDQNDLAFVTVKIVDEDGLMVPTANNEISFELTGPGEIVATDNGDPTDFTPFPSHSRNTFNGLALVIIKPDETKSGEIVVKATSKNLEQSTIKITVTEK